MSTRRKRKSKAVADESKDLLDIDPSQKPTFQQAMFVAGGLFALSQDKRHKLRDRELARVASGWLVKLGMELYESETKAIETTEEDNHQPGATETGQG